MLRELRARYQEHLFESVVPFWLKHSLDREHGGYFTCLDRDGTVYDPRKYIWMQGRAVWMFSKLYNTVDRREEWLEAARGILEFTRKYARDEEGRCYFSLTREGAPAAVQRKPYAAVFVMLGLLEFAKTGAGEGYRQEAVELYGRIRQWIADPALLGRPRQEVQQLADVMVTLSMALELEDDAVIAECIPAALRHYVPERGVLVENIPTGGSNLRQYPEGRLTCPGHVAEVCWFLLHALERQPDAALETRVLEILEAALDFGWDRDYGGLYYFLDIERKPAVQLEANMKLWWPMTEAIYAVLLAYKRTGEAKWLEWLERLDHYAFQHFADPVHGEWYGYCDRRGTPIHRAKGGSYKGFFHVPRFLLYSIQAIGR